MKPLIAHSFVCVAPWEWCEFVPISFLIWRTAREATSDVYLRFPKSIDFICFMTRCLSGLFAWCCRVTYINLHQSIHDKAPLRRNRSASFWCPGYLTASFPRNSGDFWAHKITKTKQALQHHWLKNSPLFFFFLCFCIYAIAMFYFTAPATP